MTQYSIFKCPYCGSIHHLNYQALKYSCGICASSCERIVKRGLTLGDVFGYNEKQMPSVDYYEGELEEEYDENENEWFPNFRGSWNDD